MADVETFIDPIRRVAYPNRMVRFYDEITDQELFSIVTTDLGDIEAIVGAITSWVAASPDRITRTE